MFQYQVDEMRAAIAKLVNSDRRPPEKVGILREHAEFLNLGFSYSEPLNERKSSGLEVGVMYGSVVMVKVHDLYLALKDAIGVDDEDYEGSKQERKRKGKTPSRPSRETQDSDKDHSPENQTS